MIVYPYSFLKPLTPVISSTFIGSSGSSDNTSTYTFTDQNYGGPGYIVISVGVRYDIGVVKTITGITLNGVAATVIAGGLTANISNQMWGVTITGGTSGDLVFNLNGNVLGLAYGIYRIQNNTVDGANQIKNGFICNPAIGDCPSGTTISATFTSNVQNGDIIIAATNIDNNSTVIWTDPPENDELSYASNQARMSFANKTQSITGSFTSSAQFSAAPLGRAFLCMITIR
jgi:hypothetical protein